jgi:hypothetical protein
MMYATSRYTVKIYISKKFKINYNLRWRENLVAPVGG